MNGPTILACLGVLAVFLIGYLVTNSWAAYLRRRGQALEWRCAWCDKRNGIQAKPNQTHGMCLDCHIEATRGQ